MEKREKKKTIEQWNDCPARIRDTRNFDSPSRSFLLRFVLPLSFSQHVDRQKNRDFMCAAARQPTLTQHRRARRDHIVVIRCSVRMQETSRLINTRAAQPLDQSRIRQGQDQARFRSCPSCRNEEQQDDIL